MKAIRSNANFLWFVKFERNFQEKENEIQAFNKKLSDGDFYNNDPDGFVEMTKALKEAKTELEKFEMRWLELEEEKG